jgi:hypothetical protein
MYLSTTTTRSDKELVEKAMAALERGVHALLSDLLPPGAYDPAGIHGSIV